MARSRSSMRPVDAARPWLRRKAPKRRRPAVMAMSGGLPISAKRSVPGCHSGGSSSGGGSSPGGGGGEEVTSARLGPAQQVGEVVLHPLEVLLHLDHHPQRVAGDLEVE